MKIITLASNVNEVPSKRIPLQAMFEVQGFFIPARTK